MRDAPDMDTAQRQQFLGIVVAESERLSRLVNQVLDMAKIESGHAEWLSADVDLAALLQQAAASTAELLRERGTTLQLQLPAQPLPTLRADPDRLLQVVLNLLSNAAKFVPREGGQVQLRLVQRGTQAVVEVQDNGAGVPATQQALIFEKFRQGGDDQHRPQGTGLGLPISRKIVEHFGGRLWLQAPAASAAMPGACFVFELPLNQKNQDDRKDDQKDDRKETRP
jgi:signal transduction histidine kinase